MLSYQSEELMYLVKMYQFDSAYLYADGILGPKTRSDLAANILLTKIRDSGAGSRMYRSLVTAGALTGRGGDKGTNNKSAFIDGMRWGCGFPSRRGAWCAVFASWVMRIQFPDLELSRGARKIVYNVAKLGTDITELALTTKDDFIGLASYKRGRSYQGHVRFIARHKGEYLFVGGNEPGDVVAWGVINHDEFADKLLQVGTIYDEEQPTND